MTSITIALDAMSGDNGIKSVIPAALTQLNEDSDLRFVLVGDQEEIKGYFANEQISVPDRISIHHTSEVISMDDLPSHALRNKSDSSMRVAIDLLKAGEVEAVISSGNTGALVAISRFVLRMLPGIKRPAIIAMMPTASGRPVKVLDLGANVNCSAQQLLQFAIMGSIVCQSIDYISHPTVSLLNIGAEEIKGNDLVKESAILIKENPQINYVGYVEGNDIFKGDVDVVVCDGFVGNAVLKASEGIADMMLTLIRDSFKKNLINRIRGFVAKPAFKPLMKKLDPETYNGSCLLGLKGIVVKSHGSANARAFSYAIRQAKLAVQQNLPEKIALGLQTLHKKEQV